MNCLRFVFKHRVFFTILSACSVAFLVIKTLKNARTNVLSEVNFWQLDERQHGQPEQKSFPIDFDIKGQDVIVFLHIQKTGGSVFGKHLVLDLNLEHPCICIHEGLLRCSCKRPAADTLWLFSRYSSGWPCGIHAGWTELQPCVPAVFDAREGVNPSRTFFYITIIRNPLTRFISEYRHNRRGTSWNNKRPLCNGRLATEEELPDPPCRYSAHDWTTISLEKFIDCDENLASNRQTRMLADLTLVNCYNATGMSRDERERIMLASAKKNLQSMSYFALTEYQTESQFLFEKTFGLDFVGSFEQKESTGSEETTAELDEKTLKKILRVNALDVELYEYANELFWQRVEFARNHYQIKIR